MLNNTSPYRDPPADQPRWYRTRGTGGGFLINLHDIYICKWDRDGIGAHLLVAFKRGAWWMDGHRHHNIKVYGDDATDLERALLNLDK